MSSQKEIARYLNLSQGAVSRGLRGDPRIPEETRLRIQEAAQHLGYHPNPILSQLAAHHWKPSPDQPLTECIAFLQDHHSTDQAVLDAAREHAHLLGYELDPFDIADQSPHRLAEMLKARGIRGILLGRVYDAKWKASFPWHEFIATGVLHGTAPLEIHQVMGDTASALRQLFAIILERGYRRPLLLLPCSDPPTRREYFRNAVAAELLREHQLPARSRLLCRFDDQSVALTRACAAHRYDVVISNDSSVQEGVEQASVPLGWAVLLGASESSQISGFWVSRDDLLRTAFLLLKQALWGNDYGLPSVPLQVFVASRWREGSTLPNRR